MNNFKTTAEGGLPIVLDDFRFIHNAILQAFKGCMSPFGVSDHEAVILSGCERSLSFATVTIAEGYVSLGGEICYVPEHSYPTPSLGSYEYWDVQVTYNPDGTKLFQTNPIPQETYEIRQAKITVGPVPSGYTRYTDTKTFRKIINEFILAQTINDLLDSDTVNNLITQGTVAALLNYTTINQYTDTIKTGMIIMWSGSVSAIPAGYVLCDGSNGTPNLKGRFVVGYDPANASYNAVGKTGGQSFLYLNEDNIPLYEPVFTGIPMEPHLHATTPSGQGVGQDEPTIGSSGNYASGATATVYTTSVSAGTPEGTINSFGEDAPEPIDNRPLFYTVAYIMKLAVM